MPSSTDTFYSMKRLHVMFAVASLALVACTVWMVAADHRRQWKRYQRTFRDRIEPWTTEAALREREEEESSPRHAQPEPGPAASGSAAADRAVLQRTLQKQRPNFGKWFLGLPFLDAFGRPLSIEQVWLPDLQIDYNFCHVARFDRCITCHQGVDKTATGSPAEPLYRVQTTATVQLATPGKAPKIESDNPASADQMIETTYGLALAEQGQLNPAAVTVGLVLPRTPAAVAGLLPGDVVVNVNGSPIADRRALQQHLLHDVAWGSPLVLAICRGVPQPYSGHPRLDLFLGSKSPHPLPEFGCTICHEGQGSATDFKFASHTPNDPGQRARWRERHGWFWNHDWDFPMRPKRFTQSSCLKCHHEVTDLEQGPRQPEPPAPKLLAGYHLVRRLGCFGCHEIKGIDSDGRRLGPDMRLEPSDGKKAPDAVPGTMRKVGPSLRDVSGRFDAATIAAWISDPAGVRPTTRMPQFFGLHEQLDPPALAETQRLEAVEIRTMAEYLLAMSQPVAPSAPPAGVTEAPSAERGKRLFRVQGCLACHRHQDFPEGQAIQGPDLSRAGAMFRGPEGTKWLAGWIRDPSRHSPRTIMPNSLLAPATLDGKEKRLTDPAADLAAYLMASKGWKPKPLAALVDADLEELALLYLRKTFPPQAAEGFLRQGIPKSMASHVPPDAAELLAPITPENKIRYVGRSAIRKRGCFGCHDVPGLEDGQGIGPALSDWGRKQESLLAFEQIDRFLEEKGENKAGKRGRTGDRPGFEPSGTAAPGCAAEASAAEDGYAPFYAEAIASKRREGFLWQKLRAPRSFDYLKTATKGYNEHLLMGKFTLTDAEREAIVTFVLGLVAEPPKTRYVFHPDGQGRAIVEGRKVLDRYGCAQCHTLDMERWTIEVDPARFPGPPPQAEYDFLRPAIGPERLAASRVADRRGLCRSELVGMPQVNAGGDPEETEDEDGNPQYVFTPWEPAVIAGKVWPVGGAGVLVSPGQIVARRPPRGGDFARLLYPTAIAEAKAAGSAAAATEAWGWVPPVLAHEGRIVRPAWLYDYLLDPSVIRPAAVLRMPKFNFSAGEAQRLVDYFAAVSGVEFPYTFDWRARSVQRGPATPQASQRMDRAMRFVTDRTTYCAKCHLIGDFTPGGEIRTTLAPDLAQVAGRIRPDYLRRWLASPKSVLPYTAMPVNFPPDQRMGQDIYPAPSLEQLDAVMDLLLDYDGYVKGRVSIRQLMETDGKGK